MSESPVVLHLITRFLDGGAETTTVNSLEALTAAEDDYTLVLGTGAEHDPDRLSEIACNGIETVIFGSLRHYNPLGSFVAVVEIARYLRRQKVDVLHTHSTEAGVVGRLAAMLARTPVVIHEIHGDPTTSDRNALLNGFLLAAERLCARMTDVIVVKSDRIRRTYLDRGIGTPGQYELIYHGIDLELFRSVDDASSEEDRLDLLFVGRLAPGKGLEDLLDALEDLSDLHLRIVGDGPMAADLREKVKRRDLPADLLGYREDIPNLLAVSDVLVLPSYREGTPRVVTEAMAAGVPVVATDIAGLPEQVRDGVTGYLIEPGDIEALVDRVNRLRNRQRRQEFGARGRERTERFSRETALEQYQALYQQLSEVAEIF